MANKLKNTRNRVESSMDCIEYVKSKTDEVILFCSLGKDSLVTLDMIAPHFKKVVCVFMYFVKDLDHINRYINFIVSRYPNIVMEQVPHWNLTYTMKGGMYCLPNPNIKLLTLKDVVQAMRTKYGIWYCFYGMKKADGMNRNLMLTSYSDNHYVSIGKNGQETGNVYPLADFNQKDILSYMKMHRLPEPVRYSDKASGGIGFNIDCFLWMEKNCPHDLIRILDVFPLAERILFEHHYHEGDLEDFQKRLLSWKAQWSVNVKE